MVEMVPATSVHNQSHCSTTRTTKKLVSTENPSTVYTGLLEFIQLSGEKIPLKKRESKNALTNNTNKLNVFISYIKTIRLYNKKQALHFYSVCIYV